MFLYSVSIVEDNAEQWAAQGLFLRESINQTIPAQIVSIIPPLEFGFIGARKAGTEILIFEKVVDFILFAIF